MKEESEMGKDVFWGDAQPCGILGLCTVVIPLAVLNLGWVPPEAAPGILPWLIFGGLVQIVCGIIDMRRGGLLLATPMILFGFMLCLTPAFAQIIPMWLEIPTLPHLNGVGFLVVAAFVIALANAGRLVSWFVFALLVCLCLGLWIVGLSFLGVFGGGLAALGWYLLLIFALGMVYVASAIYLNQLFCRQVLGLGAPLTKPDNVSVSD